MSEYLVDIQHERLSFFTPAGEVKALNDVSIHLNDGEVLGIVGESGSGESDLRQILESPFLARRQYSGTMKEALGSLEYFGIKEEDLNIVATFDSAEMLRDCVEAGMGISILSYQMIRELHESGKILIYRLPEKEFCRELYLIYKNESFLPEIVKRFIHYTEKYFREEF